MLDISSQPTPPRDTSLPEHTPRTRLSRVVVELVVVVVVVLVVVVDDVVVVVVVVEVLVVVAVVVVVVVVELVVDEVVVVEAVVDCCDVCCVVCLSRTSIGLLSTVQSLSEYPLLVSGPGLRAVVRAEREVRGLGSSLTSPHTSVCPGSSSSPPSLSLQTPHWWFPYRMVRGPVKSTNTARLQSGGSRSAVTRTLRLSMQPL